MFLFVVVVVVFVVVFLFSSNAKIDSDAIRHHRLLGVPNPLVLQ